MYMQMYTYMYRKRKTHRRIRFTHNRTKWVRGMGRMLKELTTALVLANTDRSLPAKQREEKERKGKRLCQVSGANSNDLKESFTFVTILGGN
jgi:hypothetical protein